MFCFKNIQSIAQISVWLNCCNNQNNICSNALTYDEHLTQTAAKCLCKLVQINRIKHLLDKETLLLLIIAFVFSKLFYCSTVFSKTSKSSVRKLQRVQNFAARIILGFRKFDHISQGIKSLKWLPVKGRLYLNDGIMMYKCINKLAPDSWQINLYNTPISTIETPDPVIS